MIKQIKEDHRPRIITQHGKSSAVLLDVSAYENMLEKIEILQEVNQARQEIENGEDVEHKRVMNSLKDKIG